jgi:hypothetical protein
MKMKGCRWARLGARDLHGAGLSAHACPPGGDEESIADARERVTMKGFFDHKTIV